MKTLNPIRNRLLPLFGVAAMIFGPSCSKDETIDSQMNAALQTRATPEFSFSSKPAPKGEGENLLALKETYRFSCFWNIPVPPPLASMMEPCELSVHASDGSTDGFEIVSGEPSILLEYPLYVKFTKPGYYHVTAQAEHGGALYQQTRTYCVVSRATSIDLPDAIRLGEPFDLKFNFADSRYPDPTVVVSETLFNDPQFTILGNDDHGNIRMRIDQPGKYSVSTGTGGKFSAWAIIDVYWRPEKVRCVSFDLSMRPGVTGVNGYGNLIHFGDETGGDYNLLPYRVYFEYTTRKVVMIGQQYEEVSGEKLCDAWASGAISMPGTTEAVELVTASWIPRFEEPIDLHWHLTIPDDKLHWFCFVDPDDVGTVEPQEPDIPVRR